MADTGQPLAEVFGHLPTDHTEKADRYRSHRLCPFNNKVPNCTKDKAKALWVSVASIMKIAR
ncbi:MAG: NotI family restriction endonuclease [Thermodesulfobacteriota bacterium]|nr:NotI family restriction endonuclease [Thermodesulfobacteriota bacterium]